MAIGNHNDLTHIVRTSDQWKNTYDKYELIPVGVLCVELVSSDVTKIKIGDGHNIFSKLPYIGDLDLSKYYTKLETDTRIKEILTQEKVVRIKGIIGSKSDLPADARCGDIYFVRQLSSSDNKYIEYIYSPDNTWEPLGGIPVDIDLSEYAKTAYVDDKIEQVNERIDDIEQQGTHTHPNKEILDQITEPYTTADKETLASLHNYDDTEIREMISQSSHTHSNKDILDATSAAFTKEDKSKLDQLNPYDDSTIKERITELERVAHEHSNKRILDRTTASFTTEYERKMRWIRLYTGCTGMEEGIAGLVPAAQAGEEDYVLSGSGEWVPQTGGGGTYELPIATTSTLGGIKVGDGLTIDANGVLSTTGGGGGGDSIAEGGGINITTDPQTGVKTISVNTGDHLSVDSQTGELNVSGVMEEFNIGKGLELILPTLDTLPAGYGHVDYVKTSGAAYVELNYYVTVNTKVVGTATCDTFNNDAALFGTRQGSGNNEFVMWMQQQSTDPTNMLTGFVYGSNNWSTSTDANGGRTAPYHQGDQYNFEASVAGGLKINNQLLHNVTNYGNPSYTKLCVFACNGYSRGIYNGKMYQFKLYENDTLSAKLIPAVRLSDNAVGFYDVINNIFYTSSASTPFTTDMSTLIIDDPTKVLNAKIGNGLQFDSNNAIEVNTGDGLQINQDGELEIDPSIIPEVTEYEAGEAIEITEVTHGDEFRVQNQEYFFDTRGLTCGLNARIWTTVNDGDILAAICIHNNGGNQVPLFVGLTEDSVKVSQNYDSNILGPNGSFDYRGKTWYFTADYALSGTDGQDTQGHIQTLPTTYSFNSTPSNFVPAAKDLIDLAVLLSDLEYPVISVKYNKGLTVNQDNELEVSLGSGLSFNQDGEIEADQYTLPAASANILGGVKVGTGLSIAADGTLSATGGGGSGGGPEYAEGDAIEIDTQTLSFNVDAIRWDISDIKSIYQQGGPYTQMRSVEFCNSSNVAHALDSGSAIWDDGDTVSYATVSETIDELVANTGKMCAVWRYPNRVLKLTFNLDTPTPLSDIVKFRMKTANDTSERDPKAWKIYVRNATTQQWYLVHETSDAEITGTRNTWSDYYTFTSATETSINVKYGNGLTLNSSNELELDLPVASDSTLGGIIVGEGLEIDNDGTISVDPTIIPEVPTYEAGTAISIEDVEHGGVTFDAWDSGTGWENVCYSNSTGNSVVSYQYEAHSPISNSYTLPAGATYIRAISYDQNDTMLWTSFSWIDANNYHFASTTPENGHYDDWFIIPTGAVKVNFGVRHSKLDTTTAMSLNDIKSVDITIQTVSEIEVDVWNGGSGWLNGNYYSGTSDTFTTNWYYSYHSDPNAYIPIPNGATHLMVMGISNENDSHFAGGGVNVFSAESHSNHIHWWGCAWEWHEISSDARFVQIDVKWNNNNTRTISGSDIKSVTLVWKLPALEINQAINVKYGDGLTVNQNNELEVNLGSGLQFDANGAIEVTGGGSGGGDSIAEGEGITITTDSQTGVKTIGVNAGAGLEIDPITNELFVNGQLPEGTIIKKLTYVGNGEANNIIQFTKKPLGIITLYGLAINNKISAVPTAIDATCLMSVYGNGSGSDRGGTVVCSMSYNDTTNELTLSQGPDVGARYNVSGETYQMFYLTKGHTGSGTSVNNEVSVVKTFSYVGTGTSTNNIQFPETPDMVLSVIGENASSSISIIQPIEIEYPGSMLGECMVTWGDGIGGSIDSSLEWAFNDTTNVLSLLGDTASHSSNISGKVYVVRYIVNEVIASTMSYDAGEAISIETIGGLQPTDFSNNDFVDSIVSMNAGSIVKAADKSSFTLTASRNDCYTRGSSGQANGSYPFNVKASTKYRFAWDSADPTVHGKVYTYENGLYDAMMHEIDQYDSSYLEFTTSPNTTFIQARFGVMYAGDSITYSNVRLYEVIEDEDQYDEISVKYNKGLSVNQNNELEVNIGTGLSFDPQTGAINVTGGGGGGSGDTVAQGAGIEITTDQQTGNKVIAVNAGTGLQVDQTTNELEIDDSVVTEDDELSLVFVPDDYQPS